MKCDLEPNSISILLILSRLLNVLNEMEATKICKRATATARQNLPHSAFPLLLPSRRAASLEDGIRRVNAPEEGSIGGIGTH